MAQLESKNYYEILGVARGASSEEIKVAYREIAKVFHPDSNFYSEILSTSGASVVSNGVDSAAFKQITAAYNTLINEERRADYDRSLPGELPDWDSENDIAQAVRQKRKTAPAWGTFGVVVEEPVPSMMEQGPEEAPAGVVGRLWKLFKR
jgi:DnaJ-class molecular chaperone